MVVFYVFELYCLLKEYVQLSTAVSSYVVVLNNRQQLLISDIPNVTSYLAYHQLPYSHAQLCCLLLHLVNVKTLSKSC